MSAVEREKRDNQPVSTLTEERPIGTRHVQILVDRSGSMVAISASMEEGFLGFLNEQRAIEGADQVKFVLSQFDTQGVDDVEVGTLASAKPFNLIPRGGTPLYQSIKTTIERAEKRMQADDVMLMVIITDGRNNEGATTLDEVRKLIAKKMDEGWSFIYLGANQDAWAVGGGMGMAAGTTMAYNADAAGVKKMYGATSGTTVSYRSATTRAELRDLKVEEKDEKDKK